MRAANTKIPVWPWAHDDHADEDHGPGHQEAEEPFDSFGPISDIRRALSRPAAPPVTQGPHDYTRVLVAEADPYHRRVLRVLLSSPRISVIEVEDGQSAIDLLALKSFDLLMLDIELPLMSGHDVIRWVRRSLTPWADIPILGLIDDKHLEEVGPLMRAGMTDWTAKPFSRHHLADKIIHLMPALYDAQL